MKLVAAFTLFLTATVGTVVLGFWSHPERRTVDPRSHRLGFGHAVVAGAAVVAWVAYLIGRSAAVGDTALVALLAAITLGASTLLSSRKGDRTAGYVDRPDAVPVAVLVVHGAAALGALTFAVLAVTRR